LRKYSSSTLYSKSKIMMSARRFGVINYAN
jgi:hypothetical protein